MDSRWNVNFMILVCPIWFRPASNNIAAERTGRAKIDRDGKIINTLGLCDAIGTFAQNLRTFGNE